MKHLVQISIPFLKHTIISLFAIVFLLLTDCKKDKSCAGFNTSDTSEFSYQYLDTLIFEYDANEHFQVYIKEIRLSQPYTIQCRDLYQICPCLNDIQAIVTDSKTQVPYTFIKMEQSDVSEMQTFRYNILGFEFEFDFRNELPYIDQMPHLTYYSSMTIGNSSYEDVIMIINTDFNTTNIEKVYFNKEKGILRYIENTGKIWTIIND